MKVLHYRRGYFYVTFDMHFCTYYSLMESPRLKLTRWPERRRWYAVYLSCDSVYIYRYKYVCLNIRDVFLLQYVWIFIWIICQVVQNGVNKRQGHSTAGM